MIKRILLVMVLVSGTLLIGCQLSSQHHTQPNKSEKVEESSQQPLTPEQTAQVIVSALKVQDMQTFSSYVHPTKGVRFSPYSYVDIQVDQIFTANQVQTILTDSTIYQWGNFDGSGEPIDLTFADYYARFIYDQDYENPEQIAINDRLGEGNSLDNSASVYPNATIIEFHFSGIDPQYDGMDWRSLRIVLEQVNNQWYLVGIIHDEWTI